MGLLDWFADALPTEDWIDNLSFIALVVLGIAIIVVTIRLQNSSDDVARRINRGVLGSLALGFVLLAIGNAISYFTHRFSDDGTYYFFWYPYLAGAFFAVVGPVNAFLKHSNKHRETVAAQIEAEEELRTAGGGSTTYQVTIRERQSLIKIGKTPATLTADFALGRFTLDKGDGTTDVLDAQMIKKVAVDGQNRRATFSFNDGTDRKRLTVTFSTQRRKLTDSAGEAAFDDFCQRLNATTTVRS